VAIRHQFSQNTPPISIEPGDGAIDPVEGGASKKLEVTICDLKKTSSFYRHPEPIGTRIDNHPGMNDDLKSQIVISKIPLQIEDISKWILSIRGHRVMLDANLAEL
jgi:hypothetical protein